MICRISSGSFLDLQIYLSRRVFGAYRADGCLEMSHPCLKHVCAPQNGARKLPTPRTRPRTIFLPLIDICEAIFRSDAHILDSYPLRGPPPSETDSITAVFGPSFRTLFFVSENSNRIFPNPLSSHICISERGLTVSSCNFCIRFALFSSS